jgi:hypothetical protein
MKNRFIVSFLFIASFALSDVASARTFKLISIDCGGMLGVIPAHLLAQIEKEAGQPIYQLVDGMMGTSTGAIISALLTVPAPGRETPYTAAEVLAFYREQGTTIFEAATKSVMRNFGAEKPDHSLAAGVLKVQTNKIFGNAKMSNALIGLQVLSFDTTNSELAIFDNSHDDVLVSDAVRASSSVSEVFGAVELNDKHFIDAGSRGAVRHVTDPTAQLIESVLPKMKEGDDVVIYSLGTGFAGRADIDPEFNLDGKKVKVIRIEPNIDHLTGGMNNMFIMNLVSSSTAPQVVELMIDSANSLVSDSAEFGMMRSDLMKTTEVMGNHSKEL